MGRLWKILTRKKAIDPVTAEETRLNRVLNTFDLTALGVGSTLGVGVYVLAGQVAKDTAGPSVVLSFLIAAVASVFAGLCYAEFGARAPRAGSAYIYSYVCVGEFIAFVIGWNLILEYVIGSASVAKGLSLYLDTLINGTLQNTFREIAPINVPYLSPYFDFFSFGISILLSVALAFGLKESSMVNNIVTGLNVLVVLFVIVAGSIHANPANWHISPNATNGTNSTIIGKGGFFPFGVEGMIKGAATCFYGFVGFDCIATTGEEVKNPRRAIPVSIIVSLFIIFLAYFGTSTVLTLMVPYYLQDHDAPIPKAFETIGWDWAKWVVAIGAIFGLCASLFGAMFPLPRIIYAMGSDGLVFRFLAKVHSRFQTPVVGTMVAGVLTGLMGSLFELKSLVNMMSIGTLLAYTIVAASVLLLRYKEESKKIYAPVKLSSDTESTSSESSEGDRYNDDGIRQNFDGPSTSDEQELLTNSPPTCGRALRHFFNFISKEPNRTTETIVVVEVFIYCILCIGVGLCAIHLRTYLANGDVWAISVTSIIVGLTVILVMSMVTQPTSKKELSFKVPCVPLIPALSILVNIYLMLNLDYMTWIRFAVWMVVGVPMYYTCAFRENRQQTPQKHTYYSNNLTNGHAKTTNGISNPAFINTEINGTENYAKKKKTAPLPPVANTSETLEDQQDSIIAQLDEILDNEVATSQMDDIADNETNRIRKLSVGSWSNMSCAMSKSEHVVADVHCVNMSPVANSKHPHPSPIICDNSNVVDTNNEYSAATSVNDISMSENPVKELIIDINKNQQLENLVLVKRNNIRNDLEVKDKNEKTVKAGREENYKNIDETGKATVDSENDNNVLFNSLKDSDKNLKRIQTDAYNLGIVQVAPYNVENKAKNTDNNENTLTLQSSFNTSESLGDKVDKSKNPVVVSNVPTKEALKSVTDQVAPYNVGSKAENLNNNKNISSLNSLEALGDKVDKPQNPVVVSNVPTEEALKSVTLRRVKKESKRLDNVENQLASDDNLKVGSAEYKNFIKNLNDKFKRITIIPTLYPVPRKDIVAETRPDEPNENVIEEHIDRVDAKEKLKSFIETTLLKDSTPHLDAKGQGTLLKENDRSQSVDDTLLTSETHDHTDSTQIKEGLETLTPSGDSQSQLNNHKNQMANVFNSIKLRKLESKGDEHLKRKLSKSLGSSFLKDEGQNAHKQKMVDIFSSIKTLRKGSRDST